jgi:hypothetical protein
VKVIAAPSAPIIDMGPIAQVYAHIFAKSVMDQRVISVRVGISSLRKEDVKR